MKKFISISSIIFILLSIASCSDSDGDCLTNSGTVIFQDRGPGDFDSINIIGYVNLILTQDCVNYVTVEAGEKIINGITTEVRNNKLYINNNNKCNWLRDYGKPLNVHVKVKNLALIDFEASGDITATNTISSNKLKIDVRDGSGTITLDVRNETASFIERMGTVDFNISGRVIFCDIYSSGFGPFHCENLITNYNYVYNYGSNDCYVNCLINLDVKITSIGNIYYRGDPGIINQKITGSGKLIPY